MKTARLRWWRNWRFGAVAIAAAVVFAGFNVHQSRQQHARQAAVPELETQLHEMVLDWVRRGDLERADGYVYTVDVAQLAVYAAAAGDRPLYQRLRDTLVEHVLVRDPDHANTVGFVAWRYRAGTTPATLALDASGTTEALRTAEALWRGGLAFDLPDDAALAVTILRGYARHATRDHGIWLVRNYYNLQTQAYATNSYLVDYDPDLLATVAAHEQDKHLAVLAVRSAALVRAAVAPTGLLRQVIQPELVTLMPRDRTGIFSPNDIEQVNNSATVAERSARSCPEAARGVLDFAIAHLPGLRSAYDATSGTVADAHWAGPETFAPLLRLAVRLDDARAFRLLLGPTLERGRRFVHQPVAPKLNIAGELLLALHDAAGYSY